MDFETYMKKYRPEIKPATKEYYDMQTTWEAAKKTIGGTMTDEDFDLAVGHVTSFYQSKRALLKKQVTHWMGKFSIVKHENNNLRQKNKMLCNGIAHHREMEARNGIRVGQLNTMIGRVGDQVKGLENDKKQLEAKASRLAKELDESKTLLTTARLKFNESAHQIENLEAELETVKLGVGA
jgi:chromosome segregation ATPase